MRKKAGRQKAYYFSERLRKQLDQIPRYPLTVVEAPSGFGKTTAVREYLKENLPPGACEYWYTCLGEPAVAAWRGICELLSHVNAEIAANLKKLEMPTMETLLYMAAILRDFQCRTETYLVVDNYQLVNCDPPRELLDVFSMHGSSSLHMIFITQQLAARQQPSVHNGEIYTIDSSAFFFDREGIASLFRMEGVRLSDEELERVFLSTDGWISAIRLQITNFVENGSFDCTADIEHLVETAIWNGLTPEEKEFLLSVSVLDNFDARQAAIMTGEETLPDPMEELLKSSDFIRYFPDKGIYTMHSILLDYLHNRFYYRQPKDFQDRILRLAGRACAAASQYYPASQFFFKVGDFDAILSMPFSREYFDQQKENYRPEAITAIVDECPEETLCRYPYTMLLFGYQMLMCGQIGTYRRLCRLLDLTIQKGMGFREEELRQIHGEYILLRSMEDFNDIRKMSESHRRAWQMMGKPSKVIKRDSPWEFGTTSPLSVYWRESGGLDGMLRDMDEYFPGYLRLTRGHGAGADSVMRAEAMLMRGEDREAEILCHKALYDARSYRQTGICLCAELVLARIAILRGDAEGYFAAVKKIQTYAQGESNLYILRMADLCLTEISLALDSTEHVAKWFRDLESIRKALYAPVFPYARMLYSRLLLLEKRYSEFYGISRLILDTPASGAVRYIMPRVYQLIYLAVAKRAAGDVPQARGYLKEALALALPDQIYLPFAQQEDMAGFLTETLAGTSSFTEAGRAVSRMPGNGAAALILLCKRQEKGAGAVKKAIRDQSPLTPREREVALLAKERLSAKEIAARLYISEATVRTILKNVYSKLGIHSKTELSLKEI